LFFSLLVELKYSFNSISGVKYSRSISKSMNCYIIPRICHEKAFDVRWQQCNSSVSLGRLRTDMTDYAS